ncbi:MAG TPA: ABC transporter ATP-binding protein [Rhizobiales bacterium]|nr:ABC transporter ATP-binding protein [Hyphomicrobiales bacterium]
MRIAARSLNARLSGRSVLRGIDIEVAPGSVVGLLGPNGAGKSTLLRALAGQIPSEGEIGLGQRPLASLTVAERSRLIAYLPQERTIGWPLSVEKLVGLGRLPWRAFGSGLSPDDVALCRAAMEEMDVIHLARRPANELSGGEQARVLAARAIAQDTPVLLADEPASGLDPAHQMTMMAAFRRIASGRRRAILVSLHDLTLAARWCDRIVMLKDGSVAAEGTPAGTMTAETLRAVFGITAWIDRDDCGLVLAPTGLAARP